MEFEFQQNLTVDSLDKVPEHFRGLYAQGDNGFVLNDSYKAIGTAVDGLNRSLRAARKDVDTLKKTRPDVSGYTALGTVLGIEGDVTPEALRASVEGLLDKVSKGDQGKVNWDKMRQQLEQSHVAALQGKDKELQTMQGSLMKYLVTSAASQAIAAAKGVPELLLPHIQSKTKVVKEGEDYVVRVVDDAGDPRGDGKGGFMTVADLVNEMKTSPVFGRAFESDQPGGGGKGPGSSGPGTNKQVKQVAREGMTPTDRIAAGLRARQGR